MSNKLTEENSNISVKWAVLLLFLSFHLFRSAHTLSLPPVVRKLQIITCSRGYFCRSGEMWLCAHTHSVTIFLTFKVCQYKKVNEQLCFSLVQQFKKQIQTWFSNRVIFSISNVLGGCQGVFYMVAEVFRVFLGYCCAIAFFPYNILDLGVGVLYGHTYTLRASARNF